MNDVYRFRLPLKNPTIRYINGGQSEGLSIWLKTRRQDVFGASPFGAPQISNDINIELIDRSVASYYSDMMANFAKPITRFPKLVEWFSDYRGVSWVSDLGEGPTCSIIIQIPTEPTFRNTLIMALLDGRAVSIAFTARFAERDDAPAPTLEAYRERSEPVFCQDPIFWINAEAGT